MGTYWPQTKIQNIKLVGRNLIQKIERWKLLLLLQIHIREPRKDLLGPKIAHKMFLCEYVCYLTLVGKPPKLLNVCFLEKQNHDSHMGIKMSICLTFNFVLLTRGPGRN